MNVDHTVFKRIQINYKKLTIQQCKAVYIFIDSFYDSTEFNIKFNESNDFYYIGLYDEKYKCWCGLTKDLRLVDVSLDHGDRNIDYDVQMVLKYLNECDLPPPYENKKCCLIM